MPLVNLSKGNRRFLYLDEFSMVEYASMPKGKPTIPVSTLLKLTGGQYMEVAASQSFHDGNPTIAWKKGIAITSKLKGLWDPRDPVTPEDINHLKNRVEQFTATVVLRKKDLKTIPPCKYCFCKQLVEQSAAFTTQLPQVPAALAGVGAGDDAAEADLLAIPGLLAAPP